MKSVNSLQELICKTAHNFELDLNDPSSLRLQNLCDDTITLQRINANFLLIGHYVDLQDGKLTGDPAFVLFTGNQEWFPVGVSERNAEWVWGARIAFDGLNFVELIPQRQKEIAERCEAWVHELIERNGSNECLIPAWLA